jgi:transcriptional regulator with GAF, ATPase, and Fis domain
VRVGDGPADRSLRGLTITLRTGSLKSVLAVRLATAAGVVGVVYLEQGGRFQAFTEGHAHLLERAARLAAPWLRDAGILPVPSVSGAASVQMLAHVHLVGDSAAIQEVRELVRRLAGLDAPALVIGESGVGKEVVARALHFQSARSAGPFVAQSCAAIPSTLFEAELFGYEPGAFTGAQTHRPGLFELATGGTLLLDRIDDLPVRRSGGSCGP